MNENYVMLYYFINSILVLFSFIMIWKIIYHFNKLVKLVNKINGNKNARKN